jgi:hypothetical protein
MHFALAIPVAAAVLANVPMAGARSLGTVLDLNLIRARLFGHNLFDARQDPTTPNLPQQCQSTCNPVIANLNNVRSVQTYD